MRENPTVAEGRSAVITLRKDVRTEKTFFASNGNEIKLNCLAFYIITDSEKLLRRSSFVLKWVANRTQLKCFAFAYLEVPLWSNLRRGVINEGKSQLKFHKSSQQHKDLRYNFTNANYVTFSFKIFTIFEAANWISIWAIIFRFSIEIFSNEHEIGRNSERAKNGFAFSTHDSDHVHSITIGNDWRFANVGTFPIFAVLRRVLTNVRRALNFYEIEIGMKEKIRLFRLGTGFHKFFLETKITIFMFSEVFPMLEALRYRSLWNMNAKRENNVSDSYEA